MFHLIIISTYLSFVAFIVFLCRKAKLKWFWVIPVIVVLLLAPFWDIWLAKGIMWSFTKRNAPLQQISSTVDSPESVLWIDNIWPGYDAYGRHWMVENYLDGVHLRTLILNGDDNKFYQYHATLNDFSESEKIRPEHEKMSHMIAKLKEEAKAAAHEPGGNRELWQVIRTEHVPRLKRLGYEKTRKQEVEKIFAREKVYNSLQEVPQVRYQVSFTRIRLPEWQEKYVWCDDITIINVETNQKMAYSKRCLEYTPMTAIRYSGGSPFEGGIHIGEKQTYEFDDKVLFGYKGSRNGYDLERIRKFNNMLYRELRSKS
jgi:hypothetical protein